ncbi:MAG: DUF3955 domain-containing protein [Chloroflexota bacterium]
MENNRFLLTGFILSATGALGRLYASSVSTVPADGILNDSFWLPLGSFLLILGLLFFAGFGLESFFSSKRNGD